MSKETTPPISISENTRVRLPLLMLLAIVGSAAGGAVIANTGREKLAEHDRRIMRMEEALADMRDVKRDVEWLRKIFEAKPRE